MAEFTQHSIHKEMSSRRNVIINTSCHHWKFPFELSANFHIWVVGGGGGESGGVCGTNFQLLMLSSNLLKSKIPFLGGGVGVDGTNFQLLMLSSNLLKSKFPFLGGVVGGTNFQHLMLSSNLLKSKIPISGGGGGWWNQLSTFDAEFYPKYKYS